MPHTLIIDTDHWVFMRMSPFVQMVTPWQDPETLEWFEPTFDWVSHVAAQRRRDNVDFSVQIRVSGQEGKPLERSLRDVAIDNARMELETYAECACVVGTPCALHARNQ
jgi:hypothetical protein